MFCKIRINAMYSFALQVIALSSLPVLVRCASSGTSASSATSTSTSTSNSAKVSTVYKFPPGTWLENIDQRASGEILTTELNVARLWQVDPRKPVDQKPVLVASFPEKTGMTGITEIAPDVFAVIAGNVTITTILPGPKSWTIYKVDLNRSPAVISKIADVPEAPYINGITFVPASAQAAYPQGLLLTTDSIAGKIWSVDLATSEVDVWASNPSFIPCLRTAGFGVNGISYVDEEKKVYFANTICSGGYLASFNLDITTGKPAGPPTIVGGSPQRILPDDFDIDVRAKKAYVASGPLDRIDVVDLSTGKSDVVAGAFLSGEIDEATSVKIGVTNDDIKQGLLYVSTAGLRGILPSAGQILAIRK